MQQRPDTGVEDSGEVNDARPGEPDAGDSGTASVGDASEGGSQQGPGAAGYPLRVTEAFCARLNQCCLVPSVAWMQSTSRGSTSKTQAVSAS